MKKKKSVKKEIIEWAIFLGIIGFLFGTGLHTPVFGFIQGLILQDPFENATSKEQDCGIFGARGEPAPLPWGVTRPGLRALFMPQTGFTWGKRAQVFNGLMPS